VKLRDLRLHDVGNTIQLVGGLWADGERVYLVPLPGALTEEQASFIKPPVEGRRVGADGGIYEDPVVVLDMDLEDWRTFIRQTDLLETEVVAPDQDGKLVKAILRKSQRQVDQGTSWVVYKRDGYRCRYCGIDGVPMTVDHLVLWEEGGPATPENLVTACRKCNKKRGNMQYGDWLQSPYYKHISKRLIIAAVEANEAVLATLPSIPRGRPRGPRGKKKR
jgi:hypothetical protein